MAVNLFLTTALLSIAGSTAYILLKLLTVASGGRLRACLKSFDKNGGVGDNRKKQAGAGENASIPK